MSFLCSACSASFDDNHQRREHMREAWHVYNVKRKMTSLPPISRDTYQAVFAPSPGPDAPSEPDAPIGEDFTENEPDRELSKSEDEMLAPEQCIFCLSISSSILQNIEHMAAFHGLVLPALQKLQTDVETLISYLGLVVAHYCECLFCGATKRSAHATRAHMLAKGHCMLNLSAGSEFLEFWQSENDDDDGIDSLDHGYQLLSKTEMRLASGAIATSRKDTDMSIQKWRSRWPVGSRPSREELPTPEPSVGSSNDTVQRPSSHQGKDRNQRTSRALAVRDQMGLTGLSDAQKRSLAVAQRKIDLSALRSRNKAQWTLEKMGNKVKQKHFVVGSPCRTGWFLDPCMR